MWTGRAAVTALRRRRRLRTARIVVAAALVLAAPFVGRAAPDPASGPPESVGPGTSVGAVPSGGRTPGSPGYDGDLAEFRVVPIPLADPGVAELLQPGDIVDLVGTAEPAHVDEPPPSADLPLVADPAHPVLHARGVRVRDTPHTRGGGRTILVEVPVDAAARVAAIAAGSPLAVLVHG